MEMIGERLVDTNYVIKTYPKYVNEQTKKIIGYKFNNLYR